MMHSKPKGLIDWFIHNHVAANILMMLFVIGGLISVNQMRTETFPSIDPRLITVSVIYPGANPQEIADGITSRIEESLLGIEGVKRVASTASEGSGVVNVELENFADADDVYNEVETAVNGLVDFPPENAERPIIAKARVTPNVLTLAIHGEAPEATLKHWAETIEDELQAIPGVAQTSLRGIRNSQISIEVPEAALRRYGLSLDQVGQAVRSFSQDLSAGTLETEGGDVLLRVQEKRYTREEFETIVIRTLPDGSTLRLADIATVVDGFDDVNLISRFQGERAAFIDVKRTDTADTITVANDVKAYLNEVSLPNGLQLSLQQNETVILKDRISLMVRNGILGFLLVFLILLLFLDLKLAFWTSAAIPVSFLGGLMLINFMGYSINMITLFALIIVLGIVVDDAIVTGESIFDEQDNAPGKDAVLSGVKKVIAPVSVGVATTMAAFGPLIFSTGTMGQIVGSVPVVVIAILTVSLLEAYFILPAHLSNSKRWSRGILAWVREHFASGLRWYVEHVVLPSARWAMRWRYLTVVCFFAIASIVGTLVQTGHVRFIFFPQIEADQVTINVTMPQGTPFEVTKQTMMEIEAAVEQVRQEIDGDRPPEDSALKSVWLSIGETAGAGPPHARGNGRNGNHLGQMIVQLVSSDFRDIGSGEIESRIQALISDLPNIETLELRSSLIGSEADIEVELSHENEAVLIQAAEALKQEMAAIEGAVDVRDSFQEGKAEYVIELNAQGLAVGLTPQEVGRQLRSAFFGLEVQRFQRGSNEVIAYVRYPKEERERLQTLQDVRIRLANGREVPLQSVAYFKEQIGYSQINTVNGRQVVTVSGDADPKKTTPNEILALMESELLPQLTTKFAGLDYSFEGETRDQREDMASLGRNMLIAMILIYVLLGSQLRSYVQPFVIMAAIPFGVVGAIGGHFVLGYDLTFISMFGMVALAGVVVNDSVVLMDYYNYERERGLSAFDATISAIRRRFRPILLTTLSTSLGLLPMLLEKSMQAVFLIPMVISLAMGLLFATFVILLLVPSFLLVVDDFHQFSLRLFGSKGDDSEADVVMA
jgi:multidrug efflux pump subunit AcrB